ncbi:MAG: hypothetical protein PHG03_04875 [Bacilli bacterium]|nr:hypothetical protein [Bacilli bacterium]MDD4795869.1 hypothetical protein [Bacilli bacterium]
MGIKYIINNVYDDLSESDKKNNFNIKLLKIIAILEYLKEDYDT